MFSLQTKFYVDRHCLFGTQFYTQHIPWCLEYSRKMNKHVNEHKLRVNSYAQIQTKLSRVIERTVRSVYEENSTSSESYRVILNKLSWPCLKVSFVSAQFVLA